MHRCDRRRHRVRCRVRIRQPAAEHQRDLGLGLRLDRTRRVEHAAIRDVVPDSEEDANGLLVLDGESGLQLIEEHILSRANSPRGDALHAVTALRFYYEFGKQIDKARLAQAMSLLLDRTDTVATAIVDLARWEAWQFLPRVVSLAKQEPPVDAQSDRAIAGFLTRCPLDEARAVWSQLKLAAPKRWQQAETSLSPLNVGR